jgi:methylenetetrahydrofolate dehydrogenase (NADP+)/methenyltetrahydrofolate cyclohydrolase
MTAQVIDGKKIAAAIRANVAAEVARLAREHGIVPGLATVLVGADAASDSYVRSKHKVANEAGMKSFERCLGEDISEADLLALIAGMNADPAIHGILVQLPLPPHIDEAKVISAIDPAKDVDGFHPLNAGRVALGLPALAPSTPQGCIILAKSVHKTLAGMDAVVVGRSNIVGKPLAELLIAESATVTVAHSKTRNLAEVCRRAELLCVAAGKAGLIKGDWIRPGATVIDVGINRVPGENGKSRVVGDVAYAEAVERAGAITPVPGGVGPMTIACLLVNTVRAVCAVHGLPAPAL